MPKGYGPSLNTPFYNWPKEHTERGKHKPLRVSQEGQPTPEVGTSLIWRKPSTNQVFLVYNDPDEGVKQAELT